MYAKTAAQQKKFDKFIGLGSSHIYLLEESLACEK